MKKKRNKKILLIQPTPYEQNGKLVKKKKLYFVGLALPLLAALTPKGYEVELCYETIEEVPFDTKYALTATTATMPVFISSVITGFTIPIIMPALASFS